MNYALKIINKFGGAKPLSVLLGHRNPTTVYGWAERGSIPSLHHQQIFDVAKGQNIEIHLSEFANVIIDNLTPPAAANEGDHVE